MKDSIIKLKEAGLKDRKKVYRWLYYSDYSPFLNRLILDTYDGIPTLEKFEEDYEAYYFENISPEKGRAYLIILSEADIEEEIGFISYTAFHLKEKIAEVDIWLKSLDYAGKGHGTEAIKILTRKLFEEKFNTLIIRPCAKNIRAIRSYKKAGFIETSFKPEYYKNEFIKECSAGDCRYDDNKFMILKKRNQ